MNSIYIPVRIERRVILSRLVHFYGHTQGFPFVCPLPSDRLLASASGERKRKNFFISESFFARLEPAIVSQLPSLRQPSRFSPPASTNSVESHSWLLPRPRFLCCSFAIIFLYFLFLATEIQSETIAEWCTSWWVGDLDVSLPFFSRQTIQLEP